MKKKLIFYFSVFLIFGTCLFLEEIQADRTGFSEAEFSQRRTSLMNQIKEGIIILFGGALPLPGKRFRQNNDFFYFTGVEDMNCILALIPKNKKSFLFVPRQTSREEMIEGPNILKDSEFLKKAGITDIFPVNYFDEFIARWAKSVKQTFYLRLAPEDTVNNSRWETQIFVGRKNRNHYNDQISIDQYRLKKLKERYPSFDFKGITSEIDSLRLIKSPEEIAILRKNGKISANAVKKAMLASKPGGYEYQVEAAAMYEIIKQGAQGTAYPPIVASGPNSCIWHYNKNSRELKKGDLILMDFGADLDYICMDISRTWPVSGKFSEEQKEVYQAVLEIQKACIETYKPGITADDVRKHVVKVFKKRNLKTYGLKGGIHHYVGMATHDVGPGGIPLREGMVFTIEPGLYFPDKNIGIRIEDTILITKDGCEVLSRDVPKEIKDIEKLLDSRK